MMAAPPRESSRRHRGMITWPNPSAEAGEAQIAERASTQSQMGTLEVITPCGDLAVAKLESTHDR